jgi:hypothetical protein
MLRYSTVSTLKPWISSVSIACILPGRVTSGHVKGRRTDGRDGGDDLAQLELIENGGLAGSVKTNHQNAHLLLLHEQGEPAPHLGSSYAHLGGA